MKINIMYDVFTSFVITVERDELPDNHDELLESVTRNELSDCHMVVNHVEWDNIKDAWRSSNSDNTTVFNAEGEIIDFD